MWYTISFIAAFLIGGVMFFLAAQDKWSGVTGTVCVLCVCYLLFAGIPYMTKHSPKYEYADYMKAKSELELLSSGEKVNIDLLVSFRDDFVNMNNLIEKSAKRRGHWFLHGYYNPETAELEPLVYDTVEVVATMK